MAKLFKLTPKLHSTVWGGSKLFDMGKGAGSGLTGVGESWELSFVRENEATVGGVSVSERFSGSDLGTRCEKFKFFPVLTKFIDAKDKLSVQVHPSDEYALANENQFGKTEMWYIVDAEEGAGLYLGFNTVYTKEQIKAGIADGSIENMLSFKPVKKGDRFFIPAGTVHAIGGGVTIFEIQQNSTLTYRLYDYKRKDKDGKERELHIDKALAVLNPTPAPDEGGSETGERLGRIIGKCDYFTAKEYDSSLGEIEIILPKESFISITAVSGEGELIYTDSDTGDQKTQKIKLGDSFLIPAAKHTEAVKASGNIKLITVEV